MIVLLVEVEGLPFLKPNPKTPDTTEGAPPNRVAE
jgi:hypothetical protein